MQGAPEGMCAPVASAITLELLVLGLLRQFIQDDAGLETVEYAILVGLITAAVITALTALGSWANTQFTTVNTKLGAK